MFDALGRRTMIQSVIMHRMGVHVLWMRCDFRIKGNLTLANHHKPSCKYVFRSTAYVPVLHFVQSPSRSCNGTVTGVYLFRNPLRSVCKQVTLPPGPQPLPFRREIQYEGKK